MSVWLCVALIISSFALGTGFFIARWWWPLGVSAGVMTAAAAAALRLGIQGDTRSTRFTQPAP